ncbi:diacylglycerol kinase family protein [Tripterygium wilfordii]|uniref:Diacylglycerol kinase n=1 Tax=Tripterygium wilfordii TaxID=458696 RepID=A0A7J7D962_TRIWF|nr:diacylglycerol kinase family protein [Tripterygium wilfordii]
MDSPSTTRNASRSSMIESIRACGLTGTRIDKEELRRKMSMPLYLRSAIRDAIRLKDAVAAAETHYKGADGGAGLIQDYTAPEGPMVVFINPRSGGRHGPVLKERLQQLMGEEQVFDLQDVKPHEFVLYGLPCLDKLANLGDHCAKETREKLRVVVAGGDGTVGWVLGCLGTLNKQGRESVPPVAIIPLGTGNDLARSFGWGGSFPFAWKSAVKRSLHRAITGPVARLDSWHILISMPSGEVVDLPHSLKATEEYSLDQIIYSGYSCTQGWFLTPCISEPSLRGLKNILRMHVKKVNCSQWEQVPVPKSVRAIVVLNLHSYGSGRNPWGSPKPRYLEKRGFVEAHADDGLLEIFGLKQGWHASFVMVELISAKHIAQAAAIRLEFRGGEWKDAYMQMDGEPWKQPMNKDYSTFVEIKKVPFHSLMVNGE